MGDGYVHGHVPCEVHPLVSHPQDFHVSNACCFESVWSMTASLIAAIIIQMHAALNQCGASLRL